MNQRNEIENERQKLKETKKIIRTKDYKKMKCKITIKIKLLLLLLLRTFI